MGRKSEMTSSAGAACGTGRVFIFHFRFISADVLMQSHFLCLSALVQSNSCGHCRAGKGVPDMAAPNREPCTMRHSPVGFGEMPSYCRKQKGAW